MKKYDVIIIGAGPGGIFSAYELLKNNENLEIAIFEEGHALEKRKCPIDGKKIKSCIHCKSCSIMSGFGGAGARNGVPLRHHGPGGLDGRANPVRGVLCRMGHS